jgi:uncharacterized metal-binding protein YceD (DUF177 family)
MTAELSWKFPVDVGGLPADGAEFELAPNAADRAVLAAHAGVDAIPALTARLQVRPEGNGAVTVEGSLQATVTQTCVVTLEAFDNAIAETISMRFAPPGANAGEAQGSIGPELDEPPDPLEGETLDLAAVVAEFLVLAVDPYPRKPGAVFEFPEEQEPDSGASPFSALAKLKGGAGDKNG